MSLLSGMRLQDQLDGLSEVARIVNYSTSFYMNSIRSSTISR